jgi:hypothetical protein
MELIIKGRSFSGSSGGGRKPRPHDPDTAAFLDAVSVRRAAVPVLVLTAAAISLGAVVAFLGG